MLALLAGLLTSRQSQGVVFHLLGPQRDPHAGWTLLVDATTQPLQCSMQELHAQGAEAAGAEPR